MFDSDYLTEAELDTLRPRPPAQGIFGPVLHRVDPLPLLTTICELRRENAQLREAAGDETRQIVACAKESRKDVPVEQMRNPSGLICREWKQMGGIVRCDQPEGHKGDHVDSGLMVSWPGFHADSCVPVSRGGGR